MLPIVRDSRFGSGKFHVPTDDTFSGTLCGQAPSCRTFLVRGDREQWEAVRPDRICKRCLAAEAKEGSR